jgi:hypothetical protein
MTVSDQRTELVSIIQFLRVRVRIATINVFNPATDLIGWLK